MTTATLTAPRRGTTTPPRGPRLMLPPVAEPSSRTVDRAADALTPPALRSVLSPVVEASWPLAVPTVPVPTPVLPDPDQLCGSLVLAAVEVLGGIRPLVQLTRWVTPTVFETLTERLRQVPRPERPTGGRGPAVRTSSARAAAGTSARTEPVRRATIRRTHLCRISATAAEASVVVHDGTRFRAAALRLEVHRGHWRATVLQIG